MSWCLVHLALKGFHSKNFNPTLEGVVRVQVILWPTVSRPVRVTLQLTVSQSVCLGVKPTLWTFDQILVPFQVFGSEICCLVSVGRPL
jgi:hypothetical protein